MTSDFPKILIFKRDLTLFLVLVGENGGKCVFLQILDGPNKGTKIFYLFQGK